MPKKEYDHNREKGNRALVSAIIFQAFHDAVRGKPTEKHSAFKFIDKDNNMFKFYCGLLDYDAEYVARKMWKKIIEYRERPFKVLTGRY